MAFIENWGIKYNEFSSPRLPVKVKYTRNISRTELLKLHRKIMKPYMLTLSTQLYNLVDICYYVVIPSTLARYDCH